ncbi:MAG: YkgJ family cysteine cluster protein [Candidatus Dadabacteria bacterium]|nr:MAG: YkgJ family cysteine cluster protein [Candidatus Dadabacteria bacterium]
MPDATISDGPIRRVIKWIARLFWSLDRSIWRAWQRLRGRPPGWTLQGECNDCGACCEQPSIRVPALLLRVPPVLGIWTGWQARINRFVDPVVERETQVVRFRCLHWDREQKRCRNYGSRPGICREYPDNLRWAVLPQLPPDCGFVMIHELQHRLEDVLSQRDDLPEEVIDRIIQETRKRNNVGRS